MDRVPEEREALIRDAALQLLDICRVDVGTMPGAADRDPNELTAATISLAVQAVCMADAMTIKPVADGIISLDLERAFGLFAGLGQGVGHVLGAAGLGAGPGMSAYQYGFDSTFGKRMGATEVDMNRNGIFGGKRR